MFVHDRHRAILDRLARHPRWEMTQLQQDLRVSRSTLRRDLMELEERGDIVRVHGGVVHRDYLQGEPTFDRRGRQAIEAKRAIADAAVELMPDNAAVYVDAGTTCLEIGRRILLRPDARIFTHSLRLAAEAASSDGAASVVLIGGEVRRAGQAVVGGFALDWLSHLSFDLAFVAASGLDAQGASTTELTEAAVKQALLKRSRRAVLVADAEKWDRPAAVQFAGWNEIKTWVVDANVPAAAREVLAAKGVEVIAAKDGAEGK